ncbi:unnamed protein product [Bursaphelenchus okinawaensis]|uniref:Uncharacterized protein n=1 Tax=Bursaphelenchus okinawaensis TaxID=465554 RepID=A0A811KK90_9BILA|nr:unnamed protein product [Bursaphelenchus okinawaensis]CAG9104716.1 unnamed protein product [Bursaphelenchus okinawaensis]
MLILMCFMVFRFVSGAFQCSSENEYTVHQNSVAPSFRAREKMFLFEWPCECEYDWRDMFCARLNVYKQLTMQQSPSVCICRKMNEKKDCSQFLTRCFPSAKKRVNDCSCCLKQPDEYCRQLDCKNMKPDFGDTANVSCLCYTQDNYPEFLCGQTKKSTRENMYRQKQLANWPYPERITFAVATESTKEAKPSRLDSVQKGHDNPLLIPLTIAGVVAVLFVLIFVVIVVFIHRTSHRPVDFEPVDIKPSVPVESRMRHMNGDKLNVIDETELHPLNSKQTEPPKVFV